MKLGIAKEATGDRDGACAVYAAAARRWSRAKPTSVTAQEALARAKALRCAGG